MRDIVEIHLVENFSRLGTDVYIIKKRTGLEESAKIFYAKIEWHELPGAFYQEPTLSLNEIEEQRLSETLLKSRVLKDALEELKQDGTAKDEHIKDLRNVATKLLDKVCSK